MKALILHSTEELIFAKLQKTLVSDFFTKERILYAVKPLWIFFDNDSDLISKSIVKKVELGDLDSSENEIFIPVKICTEEKEIISKLTLVSIYKGNNFTEDERRNVSQKKQPVRQLKIFRLAQVQEEGPHAKSISNFVWCKLK